MNKTAKSIGIALYIIFALFVALMALGMSYISDGPVPVYIHIMMPLIVLLVLVVPIVIWRRLNAGPVASPLPMRLRKHQDAIIVGFLIIWAIAGAIGYFVEHAK